MNVECELDTEMATVEPATIGEKGGGRLIGFCLL